MWLLGIVLLWMGSGGVAWAEEGLEGAKATRESSHLWTMVSAKAPVKDSKFRLLVELHGRVSDTEDAQTVAKPSIGYALPYGLRLWVGYSWIASSLFVADALRSEHRVWQDVFWKRSLPQGFGVFTRLRLEERFFEGKEMSMRLRHMLRFSWFPWASLPVGLSVGDEIFLSLPMATEGSFGLQQNRFFLSLVMPVSSLTRWEVSYIHQWAERTSEIQLSHILQVALSLSFR